MTKQAVANISDCSAQTFSFSGNDKDCKSRELSSLCERFKVETLKLKDIDLSSYQLSDKELNCINKIILKVEIYQYLVTH